MAQDRSMGDWQRSGTESRSSSIRKMERSRARSPRPASCRVVCAACDAWACRQQEFKAFRTTMARCQQGKHAGRSAPSRGGWPCTTATRFTRAGSSQPWRGQRQSGMISWTTRSSRSHADGTNDWWAWGPCRTECVAPPAGAIIICLRRPGWPWPHYTTFTTNGHEVDLRETCPMDVKAQARVD